MVKPGEETEDELYLQLKKPVSHSERLLQKTAAFAMLSESYVISTIRTEGFKDSFAAEAYANVSLKYMVKQNVLIGNIKTISELNMLEAPQEICFHIKVMPKKRFSCKTKWKSVQKELLAITFSLGPVDKSSLSSSCLFFRLYGRKTLLSRAKCYGEFLIELKMVEEKTSEVIFQRRLCPKGSCINNIESHGISGSRLTIDDVSAESDKEK